MIRPSSTLTVSSATRSRSAFSRFSQQLLGMLQTPLQNVRCGLIPILHLKSVDSSESLLDVNVLARQEKQE